MNPASCVLLAICVSTACGKKGPPLAPFPRVPAQVDNIVISRIGDDVYVSFPVPSANVGGRKPADLGELRVFAITAAHQPETEEQRKLATLVGTLSVRPVVSAPPPSKAGVDPPLALPGYDQGEKAVFTETLTEALEVPVVLPPKKDDVVPPPVVASDELPIGPLVAPALVELARRYYFVVSVGPHGRIGAPSALVSVPFGEPSAAPGAPDFEYTETGLTIRWAPSPDAKTATLLPVLPPAPAPAPTPTPVAGTTPVSSATTPGTKARAVPPPPPLLSAKSIGFNTQATTYHVFEVSPPGLASDSGAARVPTPMTPQPVLGTEFVLKGITFGRERCFHVRPVDSVFGLPVQGPASPQNCITPRDTFAPQSPKSLAAIGGAGVINLIWESNTESDLAGYLVLRGEAPGDTLQPLTPMPVRETTFRDTTVRPGTRYVYVVVAVDTADPPNVSSQSNRAEETARQ